MDKIYVPDNTSTRIMNIALATKLTMYQVIDALLDFHSDDAEIICHLAPSEPRRFLHAVGTLPTYQFGTKGKGASDD